MYKAVHVSDFSIQAKEEYADELQSLIRQIEVLLRLKLDDLDCMAQQEVKGRILLKLIGHQNEKRENWGIVFIGEELRSMEVIGLPFDVRQDLMDFMKENGYGDFVKRRLSGCVVESSEKAMIAMLRRIKKKYM